MAGGKILQFSYPFIYVKCEILLLSGGTSLYIGHHYLGFQKVSRLVGYLISSHICIAIKDEVKCHEGIPRMLFLWCLWKEPFKIVLKVFSPERKSFFFYRFLIFTGLSIKVRVWKDLKNSLKLRSCFRVFTAIWARLYPYAPMRLRHVRRVE